MSSEQRKELTFSGFVAGPVELGHCTVDPTCYACEVVGGKLVVEKSGAPSPKRGASEERETLGVERDEDSKT